jgi:L-ascorbate metabolism protein UlaG (beta-lactamase superfamily)
MPEHVDAVLRAVRGETVTHILVTHTHIDHVPATPALAKATGAKVYSFGPHPRPPGDEKPEEAGDLSFAPDIKLNDGDVIQGDGWNVEAVHTPGHISNHLCFALKEDKALLSGDSLLRSLLNTARDQGETSWKPLQEALGAENALAGHPFMGAIAKLPGAMANISRRCLGKRFHRGLGNHFHRFKWIILGKTASLFLRTCSARLSAKRSAWAKTSRPTSSRPSPAKRP